MSYGVGHKAFDLTRRSELRECRQDSHEDSTMEKMRMMYARSRTSMRVAHTSMRLARMGEHTPMRLSVVDKTASRPKRPAGARTGSMVDRCGDAQSGALSLKNSNFLGSVLVQKK